ncbi:amidohydrolase family protein [Microlunatus soli]|uniref:Cytosine deaminase n=1 Tax=Microlunatus soli TaxID=630515 RepID=A0A1H1R5P4_9ACTN|nr:amidohydrolase family protein [Microlunatus soli]SDS30259.1 cytosine deaminase [Microlunatus soli]
MTIEQTQPAAENTPRWIEGVLIETKIIDTDDGARTLTEPAAIKIENGTFTEIRFGASAPSDAHTRMDADGMLMLPSLRDTHVHLDKTFYGGPWRAPIPGRHWLAEEERLLPEMSENIPIRSNAILDLLISNGTTEVVAHCNVDHVIGTRNVERLLQVVRSRDDVDTAVVAYPQHGLQGGKIKPLLADALRAGASVIGGLDPGSRERDVDRTLDTIFDLAVEYDVGVDLHLHDPGTLGLFELDRVIDYTLQAGRQGRVSLSNANALANADAPTVRAMAERLAENRIGIGTTIGVGGSVIPISALSAAGVEVSLGSDSITDILTPFGQGDILEQVWMLAQRFGWSDERRLAQALLYGAGEPARWSADGRRAWPAVGDAADFLLVRASCTAEAVARRADRCHVFHRGRQVCGPTTETR